MKFNEINIIETYRQNLNKHQKKTKSRGHYNYLLGYLGRSPSGFSFAPFYLCSYLSLFL